MNSIRLLQLNASLLVALLLLIHIQPACSATTVVVATVTETASQPQQTSNEWTDQKTFRDAVLNSTNTYREQHNATALKWNDTLADIAQEWADDCEFKHSGGPTGENLATGYANVTGSIEGWGDERESYDFSKGNFDEKTGHFTQLVWKDTTSVGCGKKNCGSDPDKGEAWGWYLVCEYWPHGNVQGQFKSNVQSEENGGPKNGVERVWWLLGAVFWVTLGLFW